MNRSQSWKKLGPETEKSVDMRRAISQPLYPPQTTASESSNTAAASSSFTKFKSNTEEMRRRIVQLNKDLDHERMQLKNLKRDKAMEVRQIRDEEQKRAASMQADLRSKLHKEKMNELTALKEQLHKEKERDIIQIIKQKDENLRSAQLSWTKEREELRSKVRGEIWSEARDETKREFERERAKLEQEISDLRRQKDVLEDTLKLVQGADKRKIDDIRRIHHEHESELDKFKRNSWQESRKQMAEIRQLLNIIEQLEKKLGLEAGHSMRLRLEKDSLHDMLKKSTTFDAWDSLMSSSQGQTTPPVAPDLKGSNQELRMLQRKNVELSSLVRKLDEKNQQLATRNAELLAELEKLEKENRDKNRKLERNNADLVQTNKRLEGRNKMLLDEINTLKKNKSSMGRKENSVKSRGQADKEREDLGNLRAQLREQTRNIADLKQSLMEKDRRIELLRGRKKNGKRKTLNVNSQSVDSLSVHDDETLSVHSDFSEASEQSNDDTDSRRVKKLAKELLALERAYALLQAHVGSAVDAERDEMERQQLQSDLIQSQARIHELERMMNDSGQGGSEEISQLQTDNKALYQKLMSAEKERDQAQQKLSKHSEDMIDLQDQRDLLEFELEEMSQLSAAGSEDWDCRRPRSSVSVDSLPMSVKENESANLSMEEVKTCLEELETEKEKMLSPSEQNALRQARDMLDSMAQKISHLQITESALRDKVRDLDLGYNSESMKSELYDPRSPSVLTCHQETLTDLQWTELEDLENYYREGQLEALGDGKHAGVDVQKEDRASMTDLMLEELDILENIRDHFDGFPHQTPAERVGLFDVGKKDGECMTDLAWRDLVELENTYREQLDNLWQTDYGDEQSKGEVGKIDSETMTDIALEKLDELGTTCPWCRGEKEVTPKDDKEAMTEIMWEDLVEQANNQIYLTLSNEISLNLREEGERQTKGVEVGIMTDLPWSELVSLENTNLESIENTQEMGSWIFVEKEDEATATDAPPTEIQGSLPTIVLDQCLEDVRTRDECAMTDMAWDDVVDLQRECNGYRLKLENLEKKLAQFEVLRDEKSSTTDMSLQDLTILESVCEQMFKSNVEMNDAETMTDAPISDDFIEALPTIVLETYPGGPVETVETKDECDMTEGIWDEVVDLQNTYRDYRQNLDDMKVKLAQFEVEKDDKESITDMAMQDLADLENMYKDHLAENDSDANSVLSQAEKESKECMTELSLVELAELEDFYIENAARQTEAAAPVVEKWEQETMTEIASDDMQYLEEIEELYRQKGLSVDEEDVEKEDKSAETDLTIHDLDYLREVEVSYLELISREKEEDKSRDTDLLPTPDTVEKGITTDLTIPDLEHLEEVEALYQTSAIAIKREESEKGPTLETLGKEDKCEGTEMSVADLKYLEEVEAAHEECLLDKEDDESKARLFSENTSNVEVMTDLTVFDLSYLEEVEAAHEECLLDKEEAANAGAISEDKHSLGTMTDLSVSDLQDQEIALSRVATGVEEKEHVESMTDLSLSDLEYLEDIEAEHKEFLFDKKEKESKAKSVQIMTDLTVLDLKYLEYVEVAHENCMLIKEEEEEFNTRRISDEKQSVEIMTDLTVSDLKYLEDVEAAHEECLLDKEEEVSRAKEIAEEKLSVGTMTDLTVSDLRDQENAVSANERKEKSKWRRGSRSSSVSVHQENKNTMTELTANIVEYLEDIEVVYKETVVEFEEFKSALAVEKEEKEVMTDVTGQDFILLEDAEGRLRVNDSYDVALGSEREDNGRGDKETMTLLCQDDLDYLMEVDILYEEMVNHQQSKETVAKSDVEVMTDLTLSHMEDIEDEFERLQEEQLQMKESSLVVNEIEKDDKEAMTELTNSELQYLEEVEVLFKGNADNKDDAEAMTDLTTADLEYLEEAENALKIFRGNVDIQTLLVPKEDKEVITDVTSSDMEYMQVLVEKEAATFGIDVESKVEKDDKYTETEMTVADIRDLEDQAYTATEMRATPQLVNEDFQAETLMDLRSELEHLPIFDEPEFSEVEKDDKYTETEMTVADIRDLEDQAYTSTEMRATPQLVNEDFQAEKLVDLRSELEHLPIFDEPEFIFDEDVENDQGKDVGVMTDLLLSDLDNLDNAMTMRNQEELRPDTSETGVQCELKDIILMMEELRREAEKNGEDMPSWFVSALKMRKPDGGFSPVHLVVSQSDLMFSHDTDEHPQTDLISRSVLDDTPLLDLSGDVSLEPEGLPLNSTWNIDSYPLTPPDAADSLEIVDISQDVGVQCDLVDFLSMVEEYHRDTSEEEMPSWFVSAMSMNRNSSGFDPVEVVLRKRSDSSVYESENVVENPAVLTRHSTNLTIELSRPLVRSTTVTSSYPSSVDLEDDQFECPEAADAPLFTSLNASDNVFHETDSSLAPPTDGEERDVIADMPQSSAVNRFDRFLKERKDSELKNLVALRDSDESVDGAKISKELQEENEALKEQIKLLEDTPMVRELQEENELLKEQIQTLEDATNMNDLEEENTLLKERIQEMEERGNVQDLEMENELLKEKLKVLEETTDTEDLEKENALLKEIVESAEEIQEENNLLKEELAVSVQDVRKIEMENDSLQEELAVYVLDASVIEKENESLKEELAVSVQDIGKIEAENESLKEELAVSVQDVRKIEEENESLKDRIQVLEETTSVEDLEKENTSLKEQLEIMMAQPKREKELEEGNEMLKEKVQILQARESVSVEDLERENASLKEHLEIMMAQPMREKDLEDENEMLKEKVQILQESTNVEDLEKENASLKEQLEIMMAQPVREKELEEENEILKEQIQIMEDSTDVEELVNENAQLQEKIDSMEEPTRVKELEEENETLKENVQILEETMTVERLENEELKEKLKDLEESTARIVEKLEEENSSLKRKIQILEDSTARLDVLQDENAQLKEKVRDLETSTSVQGLEQENASLQERIQSLEGSTQAGVLSDDEMELLQLKIEQLKEAEKKIGTLNESNMALREKIDLLMLEKRDVRDNSSEMDPSEQLGRADRGVQAVPDVPPSVNREMQTVPGVSGGVNQEIQTNLDLMNIVELNQDGSIPEHIAKELKKLKEENRELYEELMELRRKAMDRDRQVAKHLQTQTHEATQTEHAPLWDPIPADVTAQVYSSPRDVISPVPSSIEEPIAPVVRSTVASEIGDLEERLLELENLPAIPSIHVGHVDDGRTIDRLNVLEPVRVDGDKEDIVSVDEDVCYLDESVSEPDNTSARYTPDSVMDDSILDDSVMNDSVMDGNDDRLDGLDYLDEEDEDNARTRTDTSDLVDFDLDDPEALPPLPESSPPPLPSEPPPDFPDSSPPVVDHGLEVLLRSESSPPRNAASLRASSRQRSHSDGRPSPESSLPSSRVESPVTVEETMLMLEPELSELGAPVNYDAPFGGAEVQSEKPILSNEFQRPRVPPPVHPKPKRPTMSLRQPGQLSQPSASFVPSNMASSLPSQWSRDEDDGVIPPRGIVRTRASSLNRGEIDALNEKIGFLERQLRNKENVIRSMKTEATALETQSLLERRDREMKILEDDIAFLKQENQKKERELLTKIGEMNKKSYETEQWKAEANNSERQRQRMEAAHLNLQNQLKNLQGADRKLADLQTKHSGVDKQNWELSEKVKKLERTEREFKKLEHNIQVLQNQVQEMDSLEQDRNDLVEKMKMIENQRDDLLRKGRVVESERNDFLRNNKVMEMQRDDLENRCTLLQKTNTSLNARLDELDQDLKQAQTKMHDSQHERNYLQVQFDKLEAEKNELQQRLAIITQERNSLENQVAELQDLNRDHVKLEDGFHTLRIKLAELTRQKDDAEMQIPTLKAKVSLLKRACKEKDELVDRLNNEIRELRHSIATSALDDLSKIRSYGYSPENFVKLSAQREHELERAKRDPEDLIEARLKSRMDKSSQNRESKLFQPSPPGTKKAKRFVALFDYDPYNSPTSEHPELEVKLQEGEYLTVFGDMDINGYFEADVNGVRGLVPSLYVEEVEDDNDSELGIEGHKTNGFRDPVKNGPPYKGSELQFFKDNSARSPMSAGSSSGGSEPRQCLVALDDYDPYQSGTIGHLAHEQVVMKKGDIMTSFGDMDVNGFYHVELNGQTGFVPGHLVEEVSSSTFLQPTSSRAPEQILGMLDNVPARSQPRAPTAVLAPAGISSQSYPTHALTDMSPQSHVRHPASSLPHVGMTRFKPAPEVAMLGPLSRSLQTTVTPRNSTQPAFAAQPEVAIMGPLSRSLQTTVTPRNLTQPAFAAQTTVSPVKLEKPVSSSLQSSPSKQLVPVSNKTRSSRKARPSPPGCLRILRPVNHDAMLVGWTLPEMDEFGRSNGLAVKGYKIYANRDVKLDVRSAYMAKALVEDLELRFPIKFSIKTVAENGSSSETVSAVFNDTIKGAALDSSGEAFEDSGDEQQYRTFVALYDYDPFKSSPNPNPSCEMSFKEGDILRIFDTSRKDGFYFGKLKNKKGLVPSNFVEEVAVASPRRLTAAKKQQATRSSPTRPFSRSSSSSGGVASPALTKHPAPLRRKLMVALYDYSPEEQSPQDNPDSELPFKKGQVIIVIGEMRADGFYQAEVGGHVGLVPGSFLDEYTNADTDSGLESGRRVSFEKGRSQRRLEGLERT